MVETLAPQRTTIQVRAERPATGADPAFAVGFAGGASPTRRMTAPRFYMTSDLRAATGLTRTHLDFYLREGLILPTARTESGYLLFDELELATLRAILAWRQDGLGIREIRHRLNRHPPAPARAAADAPGMNP